MAPWVSGRPEALLGALLGWALLGRAARTAWVGAGALVLAAMALGALAVVLQPAVPEEAGAWTTVRGEVVSRGGRHADLHGVDGAFCLRFPESAPPHGASVAAWIRDQKAESALPGAPPRALEAVLAHRRPARVRHAVVLGPSSEAPGPPWELAEHGGLLRALATGQRADLDPETEALLRRTGTRHLLAISGLHLGLLAGAVGWCARRVGRVLLSLHAPGVVPWAAGAAAVAVVFAYAQHVGWPVSARRAASMVSVTAVLLAAGRRPAPWNVWALTAAGLCLVDPGQLATPGFQLSFGAVAGILAVVPRLMRWLPPDFHWLPRALLASMSVSVGASLGTLPAAAWWFQELAPVGPLANLWAIPLVGGVGVPAVLLAQVLPEAPGIFCMALADGVVDLCVDGMGLLDTPLWHPAVGPLGAVTLAVAVTLVRWPGVSVGLALLALGLRPMPTALQVDFLDVGQGDAALVRGPAGGAWLVDGGPQRESVLAYLRREGVRSLDAVALSHPHADHMAGLTAVVSELEVGALWLPRLPAADELAFYELIDVARDRGTRVLLPDEVAGMAPHGAVRWRAVHPLGGWRAQGERAVNDESLVLEVSYEGRRVLFAGDVEGDGERAALGSVRPVDVVKVAHHGSRTSSTPAFVAAAQPTIALVSAGRDNRFRHPSDQTLGRWWNAALLRTDRLGTVRVVLADESVQVSRQGLMGGWRAAGIRPWTPRSPAVPRALWPVSGS